LGKITRNVKDFETLKILGISENSNIRDLQPEIYKEIELKKIEFVALKYTGQWILMPF